VILARDQFETPPTVLCELIIEDIIDNALSLSDNNQMFEEAKKSVEQPGPRSRDLNQP
jgi:hypothetical protein